MVQHEPQLEEAVYFPKDDTVPFSDASTCRRLSGSSKDRVVQSCYSLPGCWNTREAPRGLTARIGGEHER